MTADHRKYDDTPQAMSGTPSDTLRERAAHWHHRLAREPVPERLRAAFSRWLDKSPEHRIAYDAIDRAWRLAQSGAEDPRILALRHEAALRLTRRSSRSARWQGWATAAAILVLVGGAFTITPWSKLLGTVGWPRTAHAGEYATRVGERLAITLEDGSQVTLNTDSVLRPTFDANERRVVLVRGQALFEVAKNTARPFVVETEHRRFVAVGTAFDVRVDGGRVQVTMLEGTVRVERTSADHSSEQSQSGPSVARKTASPVPPANPNSTDAAPVVATITAGEQLTVVDEEQDRVRVADAERVTSWRRGQVIFENSRLADAVTEINRYSTTHIQVADGALGELRISGAFATGRPTVFVEAITSYFPIEATRVNDETLLLSPRKPVTAGE